MPKWTEYTSKDTLADNDEVMLYDATAKANKRGLMSKFWDYVVDKMATAVISKLETDNKTIIGAINALNGNNTLLHDGDILAERSLILSANHTRISSTLSFDIITNNIDISEGTVLCKLKEKYRPAFAIHVLAYTYSPKEFIEISISPDGRVTVFGKHSMNNVRIYLSVSYLLK